MWGITGMFYLLVMMCYADIMMFSAGEKITVEAHGGPIDIQGILVAKVNEKFQIQTLDIWYDPMEIFRQIGRESGCPLAPTS